MEHRTRFAAATAEPARRGCESSRRCWRACATPLRDAAATARSLAAAARSLPAPDQAVESAAAISFHLERTADSI